MKWLVKVQFTGPESILRIRVIPVELHLLMRRFAGFRIGMYGLPRRARR